MTPKKIVRSRINCLNHMAAIRSEREAQRQERVALMWAVGIIEAALELDTYAELAAIARVNRGAVLFGPGQEQISDGQEAP